MILPSVVRSGSTPKRSWAPPQATRKPVMTSSKMSTAPCLVHSSRQASRKPGCGGTTPMLPATGSTMSAAISSPRSSNSLGQRGDVVVLDQQRVGRRALGDAGAVGQREREHAAAGGGQEAVRVAVVAADELDDLLAAGEAAGDAHGAHRRLGARVDHAHELDGRHGLADEARQLDLELRGRAVARAAVDLLLQPADDLGVSPAEDHGSPRRDEVDELVAVGVPDVGALGARDEQRVRHADALHRADRRVDARRGCTEAPPRRGARTSRCSLGPPCEERPARSGLYYAPPAWHVPRTQPTRCGDSRQAFGDRAWPPKKETRPEEAHAVTIRHAGPGRRARPSSTSCRRWPTARTTPRPSTSTTCGTSWPRR